MRLLVPWKNEIPRFLTWRGSGAERAFWDGWACTCGGLRMVQEAGRGCLPSHDPKHGSLRTQGERICHTEWRNSHILKSKRSITCRQRLAPSGREGETQVAAGLPTPLKDTEPPSRAVTAARLRATVHSGYPSLSDPRGPAASSPAIAFQRTPGEHPGCQRGAGAEKPG